MCMRLGDMRGLLCLTWKGVKRRAKMVWFPTKEACFEAEIWEIIAFMLRCE